MGKNRYVDNPNTKTPIFGEIEQIVIGKTTILAGNIYLRQGEHRGVNRGFGVVHIAAEHKKDLGKLGYDIDNEEDIATYIAKIISPGATIHTEFDSLGGIKLEIQKRGVGMAAIQEKQDGQGNIIYSVVTAYPGNAKGPKIGTLGK